MDTYSRYSARWILEYWVKRNKSATYLKKLIKIVAERTKQIADTPFIV